MPDFVWPSVLARAFGARSRADDPEIQAETLRLFEELRVPLLRFLAGIGVRPADREDILQEAFLALFQHLREGRPRDNLRAWLYRVVHNLGRRNLRQQSLAVEDKLDVLAAQESWNPETAVSWRQEAQITQSVMRALPPTDREILLLRGQGLRYREIAEALDISLGAVAQSLGRSLARLTRALGKR